MLAVNPRLVLLIFLAHGFTIPVTEGQTGTRPVTVGEVKYQNWVFGPDFVNWWYNKEYTTSLLLTLPAMTSVNYTNLIEDKKLIKIVQAAIERWKRFTCIEFIENTSADLIFIDSKPKCQFVYLMEILPLYRTVLGGETCQTMSSALKAIGFALGLIPQDMRPQWREFVTYYNDDRSVNDEPRRYIEYFNLSHPIDHTSIMLMSRTISWKPGSIPVAANDIQFQGFLRRNSDNLSFMDKFIINEKYGCISKWRTSCGSRYCRGLSYPISNPGYDCMCLCEPGMSGWDCTRHDHKTYRNVMFPSCSRMIEEETTIISPLFPKNVGYDTWCVYRIRVDKRFRIKVRFTEFYLQNRRGDCSEAFLEIRTEAFNKLGNVYCGREIQEGQEFTSDGNEMALYMDVRNDDSKGFRFEVTLFDPDATTTAKPTPPTTTTTTTTTIAKPTPPKTTTTTTTAKPTPPKTTTTTTAKPTPPTTTTTATAKPTPPTTTTTAKPTPPTTTTTTTTAKPTPPTTTTTTATTTAPKTGSISASTSPNIALLYTHHVFLIFSFLWTIVLTQYLQN